MVSGNNLLAGFWQAGTGWQGFQTIATLTDSDGTFTDIAVNASNPVTVSWGATDGETSTTVLNQSIYNGKGWNNTGLATSTSPAPTADIDNIITQSGNTAQFSVLHQRAKESHGKVVFTVTRQGDMSQPVTLNYRTEDITATATADYQHSEGTITFAPGEKTKSIEVLVYEDTLDEHLSEKFQLILTPTSSSLAPFSATATLSDTSPTINLLAIDSGFQMVGPANALLTYAISGAGDVDGDGYGEFLISAPGDNSSQGKIYLIAGVQGIEVLNQGLNVDSLSSVQGLSITGVPNATTQAGYTLSNWGNYYALSAPNLSLGASGTSSVYVFQKTTLNQYFKKQTSVDITSLDGKPLTVDSTNDFGKNVLLYDLNNDGTPELIVSSPLSNQVRIYTLSGNSKTLQATLTVSGNQSLGSALQVLDLDGDGNLDIAIGASTANPINDSAGNLAGYGGAVYVLKGTGSLPQNTTTLTNSTSLVNWVFNGAFNLTGEGNNGKLNPSTGQANSNQQTSTAFYDRVGNALAVLDLNGDGHQDLAIGAPNAAVGSGYMATANLGKAYVLFGNQNPSLSNLSQIGMGQGVTFQGVLASGQAGWEVANGQDVNKDGIADLLIGAPFAYGNAGSAYIAFGSNNAYTNTTTVQLDPNISNSRVFQYQGVANPLGGSNVFNPGSVGQSLGGVGDINGDYKSKIGGNDIIIGAPSSNNGNNQGQIYAAIGHSWLQGGRSLNVSNLRGDNGFIELNANPAVGVGDVNGDGYADFVNTNGQLTLGASTLSNVSQQRTFTLAGTLQNNPAFFTSGDFNADGYQDIVAVGTLGNNTGLIIYTGGGVTQNILGGQFLGTVPNVIQTTTGDVNGDGYEDLLVLSSLSNAAEGQGQVTIYFGSVSGLNNLSPITQSINDPNVSGLSQGATD
ncbi:MAG: FG-GAP-like repeat-containing protein, partial [Microcystaceae cyanobacterium]